MSPIFKFNLLIDLPVVAASLLAILMYYNYWAKTASKTGEVDLVSRLPMARLRTLIVFTLLLSFCWLFGISLFAVLTVLFVGGLILAILISAEGFGSELFIFSLVILREFSFGFPNLVLGGDRELGADSTYEQAKKNQRSHSMVGRRARTLSPLRPAGDVKLDATEFRAVSESGQLIEVDVDVVVTGFRNGQFLVRIDNELTEES